MTLTLGTGVNLYLRVAGVISSIAKAWTFEAKAEAIRSEAKAKAIIIWH